MKIPNPLLPTSRCDSFKSKQKQMQRVMLLIPSAQGSRLNFNRDPLVGEPIHIEILGLDTIERNFGDYASKLVETFREFKHYRNDKYSHEIQIEIVNGDIKINLD